MASGPYLAWLSLTFLERLPARSCSPYRSSSGATAVNRLSIRTPDWGHFSTLNNTQPRTADPEEDVLTRIRNALAFLVELKMREMVRDAREYELKALLTDPFGERMAAATVERLHARMGTAARTPISAILSAITLAVEHCKRHPRDILNTPKIDFS